MYKNTAHVVVLRASFVQDRALGVVL